MSDPQKELDQDVKNWDLGRPLEAQAPIAVHNAVTVDQPGCQEISFNDLKEIPIPDKTDSYTPVPYHDLVTNMYEHGQNILALKGFNQCGEQFVISKEGQRLFFVLEYRNSDTEMNMAIAGRTSYDKSMTNAIAIGARVIVCVNLLISGEIKIMRKHTGNAGKYLNDEVILQMYKSITTWEDTRKFRDRLVNTQLTEDAGYALMGIAKARTRSLKASSERLLLTDKGFDKVAEQWRTPGLLDAGTERTLWHWYNSFTFNFKSLKPEEQLQKHASLHRFVDEYQHKLPG